MTACYEDRRSAARSATPLLMIHVLYRTPHESMYSRGHAQRLAGTNLAYKSLDRSCSHATEDSGSSATSWAAGCRIIRPARVSHSPLPLVVRESLSLLGGPCTWTAAVDRERRHHGVGRHKRAVLNDTAVAQHGKVALWARNGGPHQQVCRSA